MPLYQMLCITVHYPKYHYIRELVRQSATHIMGTGGVVRKIESWGTLQLPQRMRKKGTSTYEQIGDYWTLHCDASPQTLRSIKNLMRRDPRVLRWTVLKLGDRVEDVAREGRKLVHKAPKPGDAVDL